MKGSHTHTNKSLTSTLLSLRHFFISSLLTCRIKSDLFPITITGLKVFLPCQWRYDLYRLKLANDSFLVKSNTKTRAWADDLKSSKSLSNLPVSNILSSIFTPTNRKYERGGYLNYIHANSYIKSVACACQGKWKNKSSGVIYHLFRSIGDRLAYSTM